MKATGRRPQASGNRQQAAGGRRQGEGMKRRDGERVMRSSANAQVRNGMGVHRDAHGMGVQRWLIPIFILCMFASCGTRTRDVSSSFSADMQRDWCLIKDCFIVRITDEALVYDVHHTQCLPESIDDYLASPDAWFKQPKYAGRYAEGGLTPYHILAVVPANTRFSINKVITESNIEMGTVYSPLVTFEGPAKSFCPVDAALIFDIEGNKDKLSSSVAAKCP